MDARKISDLRLDNETIRSMSALSPARSLFALAGDWVIIFFAIAIYIGYPTPVVYLVAWVLIGTRMYALYSLLHDGIHFLIYPQRRVNDFLCRMLLAWPLFYSLKRIRKAHLDHHKHLRTDQDPEAVHLQYKEFRFPKAKGDITLIFLKDLAGVNFVYYKIKKLIAGIRDKRNVATQIDAGMLLYYLVIFSVVLFMGWGKELILFWFIPYVTIYQALNRLRLSTEHFHIPEDRLLQTRTVRLNFIEKFIFSPHNLGYHAEHHLYPGIPFYRLTSLHGLLIKEPSYQMNVMIDNTYFSVIKKYIKPRQ